MCGGVDEGEVLPVGHHFDEDAHVPDALAAGTCPEYDDVAFLHVGVRALHGPAVARLVFGGTRKHDPELTVDIARESRAVERLGTTCAVTVGGADVLVRLLDDEVGDLRGAERDAVACGRHGGLPGRGEACRIRRPHGHLRGGCEYCEDYYNM